MGTGAATGPGATGPTAAGNGNGPAGAGSGNGPGTPNGTALTTGAMAGTAVLTTVGANGNAVFKTGAPYPYPAYG